MAPPKFRHYQVHCTPYNRESTRTQNAIIASRKERKASFAVPESLTGRKTAIENLPYKATNNSNANFDIRQAWWNRHFLLREYRTGAHWKPERPQRRQFAAMRPIEWVMSYR
ncbi:hypothetical protein N7519_002225 [Penicillium mononematosum]|uniref:uncharacterized protein n=1 Tax=Penicillium mononematosum TaxID=268346 RepID=UPI0025469503|nr:uncharacterized protein N7519_002225 [Penicillium mononematosum]KAJ6187317.1 hypothetical protein N7519_002225 [Penicillium mononematosum]